jgi:hypothetical protein
MMHGQQNIKFVSTQQATQISQYTNTKEKLHKTEAATWYNQACKYKQLTPNCKFQHAITNCRLRSTF